MSAEIEVGTSIGSAVKTIMRTLRAAGVDAAEVDARFLMQGILGLDAAAMFKEPDRVVGGRAGELNKALRRRLAGEPVSRILGWREFYGRRFAITPDVLDPRADTETLVDLALEIVDAKGWREAPIRLADIGTGSGILILTLLAELPSATGLATDVSGPALKVARENSRGLGIGDDRMTFAQARGLGGAAGPYHLIVSNPPYIPAGEIAGLDRGVRDFDPAIALDGGPDGLAIYREIANEIMLLTESTCVAVEVGARQAYDVTRIFEKNGARLIGQRTDLGGHTRAVAFEIQR